MMTTISLNENWRFKKENGDWESVTIPHSWNGKDGQNGTGMWRGKGIYERTIVLDDSDLQKPLFLEVNAAAVESTVYINGKAAYTNKCPYSMYRVPLNEYVVAGDNQVCIEVDNAYNDLIYPQMADFSFYGGLYRDVNLIVGDRLSFDYLDGSRDGVYISAENIGDKNWEMRVQGTIVNAGESGDVSVYCILRDADEVICEKSVEFMVENREDFSLTVPVENPHLWQGRKDPYLYTVQVLLVAGGNVIDSRVISFGFRKIEISAEKGLFLNGEHIKLRGMARHQDFAEVGNAVTKEHMQKDMELLLELGANSVRLSHYQHDDYFYRLCDEYGILTWAEVPFISAAPENEAAFENIKEQMERLVKQCYNHTSIYCWGIQNEITIAGENEKVHQYVRELEQFAKMLDATRYSAQANVYSVDNASPINSLTDLVGYNLYYGWYYKTIPDLQERLDQFHVDAPNVPLLVTEYGVDTNPVYHSYEPAVKDYTEEYQLRFCDNAIRAFEERDFVMGSYVWNMADFGSENRAEGGRKGQNMKGLVTIDRNMKKDAFYLYKAYWSKEPFVKLASSRFVNRHKEENEIIILSNLKKLCLYVDGNPVGETEKVKPMTRFTVCLPELREYRIAVKGYDDRGEVYEDEMTLVRVAEADKSYEVEKQDNRQNVANWFEKFDFSDVTEVEIDDNYYSTRDTLECLMENEEAKVIVEKYLEILLKDPRLARAKKMTVDALSKLSGLGMPKGLVPAMNRELNKIKK